MPPLFKSPLLYGLRFGQCQCVRHRPGAQVLGLRIQMRVDIRRGRNITVAQPLLNLLHRHALFQQQAGAGMAQIVKANPAQTILFQQLRKACRYGIRLEQISHCIHKYIAKVFLIIAVAADFLVVFLLLFDGFQALGNRVYQRQGAQTRFCFGSVSFYQNLLAINAGAGHDMADAWNAIKELLFDDDAKAFVEIAKDAGVPAPDEDNIGYEVEGDDGEVVATVEIAWPDRRIGFMTAEQAEDKEKLEKLGWRILNLLDIANMDVASYFGGDNQ